MCKGKVTVVTSTQDVEDGEFDDTHVHDQLPSVEEVKTTVVQYRSPCSKTKLVFSLLAILGLIGISTILGVALKKAETSNNTVDINGEPKNFKSRYDEAMTYLANLVDEEALTTVGTPQNLAVVWMATQDTATSVSSERFLQRYVLMLLFYSTKGKDWKYNLNFAKPLRHECNWNQLFTEDGTSGISFVMGISCDANKRVSKILIDRLNLVGTIPAEISLLTKLTALSLDGNSLTGSIPSSIHTLALLGSLTLGYNKLDSSLPTWIGSLQKLRVLSLSNNEFTGTIPESLIDCKSLLTLALDDNKLHGNLSILAQMSGLQNIYLEDNEFTGTISFRDHNNLEALDASNNRLEGNVPSSLVSKPKLRVLDLHGNSLSGSLVPDMMAESISLEYLALQNNYFEGPVPQSINQLSRLKYLDVSSNALTGNLPSTMQHLTKLEYLFLANNTGFQPGPVPDFLRAMTLLEEVSLKATSRTGTIPDWIGDLTLLKLLDVDMNTLTGTLPASIGSLDSLRYLLINRNELNGTIPADISQLSHLEVFVVDNNSITGNTPGGVSCDMPRIDVLIADCGGTMGSQPEVDCPCCSLCCEDSNATCNDVWWLSSYDPLYEVRFRRTELFVFSPDAVYRPTNSSH